jgi:hypothetical protein
MKKGKENNKKSWNGQKEKKTVHFSCRSDNFLHIRLVTVEKLGPAKLRCVAI